MPISIETMQQCQSWHSTLRVLGGGHPPRRYLVTLAGPEGYPYCANEDTGEQCTANKFNRECRHVKDAMRQACLWHANYDIHPPHINTTSQTKRQEEAMECPTCHKKTMWIRVAV